MAKVMEDSMGTIFTVDLGVGPNRVNHRDDVTVVRYLLNLWLQHPISARARSMAGSAGSRPLKSTASSALPAAPRPGYRPLRSSLGTVEPERLTPCRLMWPSLPCCLLLQWDERAICRLLPAAWERANLAASRTGLPSDTELDINGAQPPCSSVIDATKARGSIPTLLPAMRGGRPATA